MEPGLVVEAVYSECWYPGVVIEHEGDDVLIEFLGYKNIELCPPTKVRCLSLAPTLEASKIEIGMSLEAYFPGDSTWYPGVIVESQTEHGFIVNFPGASREELPINYLRTSDPVSDDIKESSPEPVSAATSESTEVLPQPDPDAEQRQQKKKQMKQKKTKEVEKEADDAQAGKQASWQSFVKKSSGKRVKGAMARKPIAETSMFTTTMEGKVGVTGSGQGTTDYEQKKRFKFK